jgi:threonine dehydratase
MTLVDVFRARRRIAPYIRRTPLVPSAWLSDLARGAVSLKLESLQRSNSFKSRGAFNAVIARLERGAAAPTRLVTASAGNHGRALAEAAEAFRIPLVVFTPFVEVEDRRPRPFRRPLRGGNAGVTRARHRR